MNKLNYGCKELVAVISGGTSGIGLATAEKLAADGARAYILGRDAARGAAAVRHIEEQTGVRVCFVGCDVKKAASCKEAAAKISESEKSLLGEQQAHIDILVNSAGVYA